jgi:hypothetical protein
MKSLDTSYEAGCTLSGAPVGGLFCLIPQLSKIMQPLFGPSSICSGATTSSPNTARWSLKRQITDIEFRNVCP